jgi:hypothetical protein
MNFFIKIEKAFPANSVRRRILDVGGTGNGFVKRASPELRVFI